MAEEKSCSTASFRYLMATQFLVALNDNIFKLVVGLLMISTLVADTNSIAYLCASQAFFVLPFILFSSYAGYFADRYSKTSIIRTAKAIEIVVMSLGAWFLIQGNAEALVAVVFLMGLQSTLFSPSKYGIMPELLSSAHLSKGNGYLELFTFLAIIIGSIIGGMLVGAAGDQPIIPAAAVIAIALTGFATSFGIARTPVGSPDISFTLNPFRDVVHGIRGIMQNRALYMIMLAICYFWAMGAFFQVHLLLYARDILGVGEATTGLLLAAFAVGIGAGSVVAGVISEGKVEIGLVPLGGFGIALFTLLLAFSHHWLWVTYIVLFCLGVSSGFFIVPLNAYFQKYSPEDARGRYLAALNVANFTAMFLSYGALYALAEYAKFTMVDIAVVLGVVAFLVAFYILRQLPEMLLRCINWIFIHAVYRLKVVGMNNIPHRGGALLVCNHVSYVDAPLLAAAIERPVRFLMHRSIYNAPVVHPVAKAMGAIPVAGGESKDKIQAALGAATDAVRNGELVCIFAEGGISRTGQIMKFKRGLEGIMNGVDAPIIPVYLDQLWGSVFSFRGGKFFWKRPKRLPYPVTLAIGEPIPGDSQAFSVRQAVSELGAEAFLHRDSADEVLPQSFFRTVRRSPDKLAIVDSSGARRTYESLLEDVLLFSQVWGFAEPCDERIVLVDMPPSVEAVITTMGLILAGKVPCHVAGFSDERRAHVMKETGAALVVSEATDEMLSGISNLNYALFFGSATKEQKSSARRLAKKAPLELLIEQTCRSMSPDDTAAIIFTRGRTGAPLPVELSHHNIISNCVALHDAYSLTPEDTAAGILPFSISGGMTLSLWLPLLSGMRTALYRHPGQWDDFDELCADNDVTFLPIGAVQVDEVTDAVATESLSSLRSVLVGGDTVSDEVLARFAEKFGVEPLLGYGCAELSPVALVHVPPHEDDSEDKATWQFERGDAVGHPLPGVAVKVVNGGGEGLPPGEEGELWIKGPNVMRGYYGHPERTAERIHNGWFATGDRAVLDSEGFVTLR